MAVVGLVILTVVVVMVVDVAVVAVAVAVAGLVAGLRAVMVKLVNVLIMLGLVGWRVLRMVGLGLGFV